jgi:hypothetical protein
MRTVDIVQSGIRMIVRMHVFAAVSVPVCVFVYQRLMVMMVFAIVAMRVRMHATIGMAMRMNMPAGNGGIAYAGMGVSLIRRM